MATQGVLPILNGPALVAGPPFLCFELSGKPGHKGRHRSRIVYPKNKFQKPFIHNYPDPETEKYEVVLRQAAALAMGRRPPSTGPLALVVHAYREIPESWSKTEKREAMLGTLRPTSRPDGDNYLKIVDALNGVAWIDDAQIVDARVLKYYSDEPALRIEVRELVIPT